MALVRCTENHSPPASDRYIEAVRPVGYPNTAAICGRKDCEDPGVVWLTSNEKAAYDKGERIFTVPNAAVKIKVE